jgi:hypothetical protein
LPEIGPRVEDGIGDTTRLELGPVRSEVFPEGPVPGDEEDGGEEIIVMAAEREKLKSCKLVLARARRAQK